jgi:glycosyltransferase involved in cell wall biosynthesis
MVTVPAPIIGNPAGVDASTPPPDRAENPPGSRLRVAIVGTVGLPSRYGGFETLAQYLVEYLGDEFEFTVYCSGPDYKERPSEYMGARLVYIPLRANGAQSIPYDLMNYAHAWRHTDVLLVLGCSGTLALGLGRLLGKPSILNVGGLEWQRSKWGRWARNFLRISEWAGVVSADHVVSDNIGISYHLRKAYKRGSTLIEYGGDHVSDPAITEAFTAKYPFLKGRYGFALARIQPDNNPELVLHAFNQVPEMDLVFIGTWNRSEYGRELKRRYENYPNLRLLEAIYDPDELNVIRGNCAFYVHGHSAGGTNPALVEAMNMGLPIASFDVAYNRATTENSVKYFRNVAGLAGLIIQVEQAEWDAQRPVVRAIAKRRYGWKRIVDEYGRLFRLTGANASIRRKSAHAKASPESAPAGPGAENPVRIGEAP